MATVWMLKHHIDTLRRDREDALIFGNLVAWATDHRETWQTLKSHVTELYGRVA